MDFTVKIGDEMKVIKPLVTQGHKLQHLVSKVAKVFGLEKMNVAGIEQGYRSYSQIDPQMDIITAWSQYSNVTIYKNVK